MDLLKEFEASFEKKADIPPKEDIPEFTPMTEFTLSSGVIIEGNNITALAPEESILDAYEAYRRNNGTYLSFKEFKDLRAKQSKSNSQNYREQRDAAMKATANEAVRQQPVVPEEAHPVKPRELNIFDRKLAETKDLALDFEIEEEPKPDQTQLFEEVLFKEPTPAAYDGPAMNLSEELRKSGSMLEKALQQAEPSANDLLGKPDEQVAKVSIELPRNQWFMTGEGKRCIILTVLGDPTAQKRHKHTQLPGAKFVRVYDPSAGTKADFLSIIQKYAPETPFECPLRVDIDFYFDRPKAHFNSKGLLKPNAPVWKISKPDRDNLDKLILDSMSKIYWKDDSIACDGRLRKLYDSNARTVITITEL